MNTPGMRARIGMMVIGLLGVWSAAEGKVVYVAKTGSDADDGLSWATAKVTVQVGLSAAAPGDEVWVAAGTYVERITLTADVAVYGGFAGNEADRSQRDWKANLTILDGNQAGSVVTVPANAGGTKRIDGFIIRNGKADSGGGIVCTGSDATISNNTITGNTANVGGGVYCTRGSPTISNNTIRGNMASAGGGGIRCTGGYATISNNTITGNTSNGGGGIECRSGSPTISNNTITGNTGVAGGGGIWSSNSSPTIVNTIIAFNSSGIRKTGSNLPVLRNNCFYGNTAYNYSDVTDPTGTDGNISIDPKLLAADFGDVHLTAGSPCVDAGDDSMVQSGWVDMDGKIRVHGEHVDIGADEYSGTPPSFTPRTVRISPSGDDANDGSSWERAKRTVQAGIDAAAGSGGGDVWVAAGTYTELITMRLFVHAYGGFSGAETSRDQRDWVNQVTILDGSAGGSVVSALAGSGVSVVDGFTIRNGKASAGGGLYCQSAFLTISNNTITGNTASDFGGGICTATLFSPTITNNTVTGNTASSYGGGIYAGGSPTISNNTIRGNIASQCGGGICCRYSSPTISNNTITENATTENTASFYGGGGIYCDSSSPAISNNTITGNLASYGGGGICCDYDSSPTISNNTITGNTASYDGGGIYCDYNSSPTILNTIVAFNSSGIGGRYGLVTPGLRSNCVYGNAEYNYSNLTDPTGTDGNISVDPSFVRTPSAGSDGQWATADDDLGDLHLKPGSPCIDAGDNNAVPAWVLTDLDGLLRFVDDPATPDTGLGTAPIVDMGAYEYVPGDFDHDGDVDADDMKAFAACVSGPTVPCPGDCAKADFDRDRDVDQSDFGLLQRWLSGAKK